MPSGLKWAKCNLGANVPESAGLYYSWGNVDGHPTGSGYDFTQEVYDETPAASITENLNLTEDAAHQYLGGKWRMPSNIEMQELVDSCNYSWINQNGVNGILFTSKINGRSIFLPASGVYNGTVVLNRNVSGFYWSNTWSSANGARSMEFNESDLNPNVGNIRYHGHAIRPIYDPSL